MNIRDDYKKHKMLQEQIVDHYALEWLKENVIVITEQIDRDSIQRLISSISKFDEKFGKFKDKVPAIAEYLTTAEEELQAVITGHAGERKASKLLKKLTFLYRFFSNFFSKDLPVLLITPVFSVPKDFPSMRLDVLQAPEGRNYNPVVIRDALKHALTPSKDELKLLSKIYRGKLPVVNTSKISQQMLGLTYNDLLELSKIGKIPMATDLSDKPEPDAEPMKSESVDVKKKVNFLTEKINTEKAQGISNLVAQIFSRVDMNLEGLSDLKRNFDKLAGLARKELANGKWDIPGKPTAMKQMIIFYNLLDSIKEQWDAAEGTFTNKTNLSDEEKNELKMIISKAGQDNVLSKLTGLFKTKHAQGLGPADITNAIMKTVDVQGGLDAVKQFFNSTKALPVTTPEGEPKLGNQTKKTEPTEKTTQGNKTEPTVATANQENLEGLDPEKLAADMVKKLKLKADQIPVYQSFIQNMKKAGYSVKKS